MTDLALILLGAGILAALACKAGHGAAWRGFVVLLALAVIGSPLACLMWGVP